MNEEQDKPVEDEEDVVETEAQAEDPVTLLTERVAELEAELAQAKEASLRALADSENTRKRFQREAEAHRKFAVEPLAKSLLPAIDNLYRGLEAVSAEDAEADPALKNLRVGVEMTLKELLGAFEKHSIEEVDPKGEAFDANAHQAMFEQLSEDEPGTVIQVITRGYRLHDRLLRAAMVGVSKGPA